MSRSNLISNYRSGISRLQSRGIRIIEAVR